MNRILAGMKKRWNAYLKKLGDANQKTYGNQRLNCCDMPDKKKDNHLPEH